MPTPQTKIRQGAVLAMLCCVMLGHVAATQWFAHHVHYQDEFLGEPLAVDKGFEVKLYAPHKVYVWWGQYRDDGVDDLFMKSFLWIVVLSLAGILLGLLIWFFGYRHKEHTSHGSSRFAREEEIEKLGLTRTPGELLKDKEWVESKKKKKLDPESSANAVIIGKSEDGKHYHDYGDEHLLVFAPTRSGKGVGIVIPTLFTWKGSVVVSDIKGENFQITGWWRSLFSHVIYLNPTDPNSAKFNPLLEISRGVSSVRDAMNLATILGGHDSGPSNPFWDDGAKKLLTATILYTLYTQQDKSLGRCTQLLMHMETTLEKMLECDIPEEHSRRFVQGVAAATLAKSENVRGGWTAGADGALDLWKDPIVASNTKTSDFRLKDLQYAEHPISLYLVLPPGDLSRLTALTKLFFQQLTDALTETLEDTPSLHRHRLLMLLDEFPQLGRMDKIEKMIAYTAGYLIKWLFIAQGLDQFEKTYGKEHGFVSGSGTRIAYRCNDHPNAEKISKMLGKTTGLKQQEGESGKKSMLAGMSNKSLSQVEFERFLVTPGELMQLDGTKQVLMISGNYPILAKKVTYYDDPRFINLYKNRTLSFPEEPLKDFPSKTVVHDWLECVPEVSSQADTEEDDLHSDLSEEERQAAVAYWKDKEIKGGVSPVKERFDQFDKLAHDDIDEASSQIDPNMQGTQMRRVLTTRSFDRDDLLRGFEIAHKKGLIDDDKYARVLEQLQPSPDTSSSSSSLPRTTRTQEVEQAPPSEELDWHDPFGMDEPAPTSKPKAPSVPTTLIEGLSDKIKALDTKND